jgi:pimeloyl-ACP methyl ester carboxylesterase
VGHVSLDQRRHIQSYILSDPHSFVDSPNMPSVEVNGKSVFYTIDQNDHNPAKTTALLIHGLGSSSCFYRTITPSLKSTIRCIALDTPGSGLSELGKAKQSVFSIAQDAVGLLDELQVQEKVVLVGHSMGGIVANYIAAEYPDRVKGVVLIGPVNPDPALASIFDKRIEVVKKGSYRCHSITYPIN